MQKIAGIWVDTKQAFLAVFENGSMKTQVISSDIEDFHPVGGSRSKTVWGSVETVSEKKFLQRKKHQEQGFFDKLLMAIKGCSEVYIFGPAEIKFRFNKYLLKQPVFKTCKTKVETSDKMTDSQKIARIKAFFEIK